MSQKSLLRSLFSWTFIVVIVGLFVATTWIASVDGQGAFLYFLSLPICGVLVVVGYYLSPSRSSSRFIVTMEGVFLVAFVISAVVPPLRFFPNSVGHGVAKSFEALTGLSPFAWAKQQSPAAKSLREELKKSSKEITLAQMSVVPGWNRICVFGPYSTEEDAAKLLGYYSATLAQSRVPHSDSVSALVFGNDKGTIEVIDIDRSLIDFAGLSRTCLTTSDFPLFLESSAGRKVVKK